MVNQISLINDGYVQSVGLTHSAVAGPVGLAAKGSFVLWGVCSDYSGNIFVADSIYHVILKVTPNGNTYLYGGISGTSGNNGSTVVRQSAALFNQPIGLACDAYGNLYVADSGNHQIRKITPDGWVTLLAGDPDGTSGYVNGTSARFNFPMDIAVDTSNNIYVADYGNNCIRYLRSGLKTVCTISGTNASGDVFGPGSTARYNSPISIAVDAGGTCYIADFGTYKIKRMTSNGYCYSFSGTGSRGSGSGVATSATFNDLYMVTTDRSGNVYAIDYDETAGARLLRLDANGYSNVEYNFLTAITQPLVIGIDINRSGKLYIVESDYEAIPYSSSSTSSSSLTSEVLSHSSSSSTSSSSLTSEILSHSSSSSTSSSSLTSEILSHSSSSSTSSESSSTSTQSVSTSSSSSSDH